MANQCQQLFRMLYEPGVTGTQEGYKKRKTEICEALKTLEDELETKSFLCGGKMTIGDIIVFNEISQFLYICDMKMNSTEMSEMKNIAKWYAKIGKTPEFAKLDKEMKDALSKCQKHMPN